MVNKSVIFIALWLLLPVALASQPPYYHPGFHAVPMVSQSGRADIAITTGLANVSPCLSVSANWFPVGQWVVDGAVMGFGRGLRLYTHGTQITPSKKPIPLLSFKDTSIIWAQGGGCIPLMANPHLQSPLVMVQG